MFKFDESKSSIPLIIEKIQECFTHYTYCNSTFDAYRSTIRSQETEFKKQIDSLFSKNPAGKHAGSW